MLTDEIANELERVFGGSNLFAKWPDFRTELQFKMGTLRLTKGQPIFTPGDNTRYLYLVMNGSVIEQSLRDKDGQAGPIWLELKHETGSYFGQHALFTERYDSYAVAGEDATILTMAAADLRAALERNPELYEELLQEKLAGRLRRIPLLRSLQDWQVRRLTQVIQDKQNFTRGELLPLNDKAGVWIVDWGQIEVTGPASRAGGTEAPWRISAGSFIVAGGTQLATTTSSTLRAGQDQVAHRAEARAHATRAGGRSTAATPAPAIPRGCPRGLRATAAGAAAAAIPSAAHRVATAD